jgi:hypothetical protein
MGLSHKRSTSRLVIALSARAPSWPTAFERIQPLQSCQTAQAAGPPGPQSSCFLVGEVLESRQVGELTRSSTPMLQLLRRTRAQSVCRAHRRPHPAPCSQVVPDSSEREGVTWHTRRGPIVYDQTPSEIPLGSHASPRGLDTRGLPAPQLRRSCWTTAGGKLRQTAQRRGPSSPDAVATSDRLVNAVRLTAHVPPVSDAVAVLDVQATQPC